jgi:hypothetical protein
MVRNYKCSDCETTITINSSKFDLGPMINCPCGGAQEAKTE